MQPSAFTSTASRTTRSSLPPLSVLSKVCAHPPEPRVGLRGRFEGYLREQIKHETAATSPEARLAWRLSRYDNGLKLLALARALGMRVEGATVLDAGGAFGGDILPFTAAGAQGLVTDWLDHGFGALVNFAARENLPLGAFPADSMRLPLRSQSVDLVLSLDVVEHLPSPERFAQEVARILTPGGMAFVTTPPRWRFLARDPHYGVPFLHALPHPWREPVARRIFHSDYPYPVYRIYESLEEAAQPFRAAGLMAEALMPFTRKARTLEKALPPRIFQAVAEHAWDLILVTAPESGG